MTSNSYSTSSLAKGPVFETKIEQVGENEMLLNLGPQHPSTHGVLRVVLKLDGEVITDAECDLGYLHRGVEKLAENRTYPMIIVLSDRDDYLSAMNNNWAYCMAVEKLLKAEIPIRADYIRVIVGELNRIASHMVFYGTFGIDIGAFTPFLHAFGRDREEILDLFEEICGARITYNFVRVGGVMLDVPEGWIGRVKAFVERMKPRLEEYDGLLTYNPIFMDRTIGVGQLPAHTALDLGVTGPALRGSGIQMDLRKDHPYSVYKDFKFDVPVGKNGDCYDRFMVRRREMSESLKIVEQACDKFPEGPIMGKVGKVYRPGPGEVYTQHEGPRGWLGTYIVSDGTDRPYRLHIRPPSFINLQALKELVKGWKVADVIAILGSLDFVLGEVDR
ncbi:MAG: NADH-quinone oxidoreductase subunit 4 [Elusimicrobia bacterium]|nr:NADH-quinone oxidoreductase subunit 4 [Elusimicrobiota bacterium]